jgi:hypothetical protein
MVDTPATPPPSPSDAPHSGRGARAGERGQAPHEPTEESRIRAKTLAGFMPVTLVAVHMDIDVKTLRKHYGRELASGRAAIVASVGSSMIQQAMQPDSPTTDVRLRHDARKFVLARLGGWNQSSDLADAEASSARRYDFSHLSLDMKRALLAVLAQIREGSGDGKEQELAQIAGPDGVEDAEFTEVVDSEESDGSGD